MKNFAMRKLGLLATAAVLSLAGATASRAESVIVQDPAVAPGQQVITERTIEPGLFGDQFVRERTIVTQPMVTEQTVVAPAPRVVRRVEPRYRVIQTQPAYQPGVTTTVVNDPYHQSTYWNDYAYAPAYNRYSNCVVDFDGIRRCY
ncbi:MAG: hypothetical protein AB1490_07865 [Pseudomonadota bacterium]